MNKRIQFLHTEYASYRDWIVDYFTDKVMHKTTNIFDPWAGTGTLLPIIEREGKNGLFIDILPVHFVVNKPKKISFYLYFRQNNIRENNLVEYTFDVLKNLNHFIPSVSDSLFEKKAIEYLVNAWEEAELYGDYITDFIRAIIVLLTRYYAGFVESLTHSNWLKVGGRPKTIDLKKKISEKVNLYFQYYGEVYRDVDNSASVGNIELHCGDFAKFKGDYKFDTIITSPSYRNNTNHYNMYLPELVFLNQVGFSFEKSSMIGTDIVKDYKKDEFEMDLEYISNRSPMTYSFIKKVIVVQIEKSFYYPRIFCRHYGRLFRSIEKCKRYLTKGGTIYVVVQTNVHRGNKNEMASFLLDFFQRIGFKSMIADEKQFPHMGKRNISRKYPCILDTVPEQIIKATK